MFFRNTLQKNKFASQLISPYICFTIRNILQKYFQTLSSKRLHQLAQVKFGPHETPMSTGEAKYLLASDFDDNLQPSNFKDNYIDLDDRTARFMLQPNDVILAGKGHRLFTWAYHPDFGTCVPSSLFYIIRTDPKVILGKYLALFLNSEKTQHQLKLIGAGASVVSIPKKELNQIAIFVPPIKTQQRMIEMADLIDQDIHLTTALLQQKKILKHSLFNTMINQQINTKSILGN